MNYTLNQLRVFVKIVELQHITKAADALHLTQPAVSIQLKNFQQHFDIPLTEVINKRLYVTDFGHLIAGVAKKILEEADSMDSMTQAFQGHLIGRLCISTASTGKYVIPYFLTDFLSAHRDIELVLDVTNRSQVLAQLERNELDFALVSHLPVHLDISHLDILENRLQLIGPAHSQDWPDNHWEWIESVPLIFREEGSATRLAMEEYIRSYGVRVRKKLVLTSNEAVKQAVMAGLGYSVMPLIGLKNELQAGQVRVIPMEGLPLWSRWHLVWLKEKKHSPAAQAYLKFMQAERTRIAVAAFGWLDAFRGTH